MKTTPITPTKISHQILDSMAEYVSAERGRLRKLAERCSEISGEHVRRQQVERWLSPDREKREMPSIGAGIMLQLAIDDMALFIPMGVPPPHQEETDSAGNKFRMAMFKVILRRNKAASMRKGWRIVPSKRK